MNRKYKIGIIILIFGLLLMGINIAGFFIPLRNADIYTEKQNYFKDDILFNEQELLLRLERKSESDEVFVTRVNDLIFKGIAHYWKDEGIKKYNIRIPIHENYLLFMAGIIFPSKFEKYEFTNYKKGIERGVGLCSQHSIILSEILERNKIQTKIVGMSCHVVVMAQVDKTSEAWWLIDPDFGVIIKNNITEIRNSPEKIQAIYMAKGYDDSTIKRLTNCYGNVDRIYDGAIEYSSKKRYYIEKFAYVGKWLIPILLLLISINLITKNKS